MSARVSARVSPPPTPRPASSQGDPDLFVSNVYDRPDEENFVWRSMGGGEVEELTVEPDDPRGGPGTYYITVAADKASEYRIEVALVKPAIALPPRPRKPFDHGQRDICRALKEAHARRFHTAAGHVTLSSLPATLGAHGHAEDTVLQAGRPAAEVLRQHSSMALHSKGVPKRQTRLALSRSLAVLPGSSAAERSPLGGGMRSEPLLPARPRTQQTHASSGPAGGSPPAGASSISQAEGEDGNGPGGRDTGFGAALAAQLELTGISRQASGEPRAAPTRGLKEVVPEIAWSPPEGYSWEDLPTESRLLQVLTEGIEEKRALAAKLHEQLGALDGTRALKHAARTQALAHVDPLAHVCRPHDVRQAANTMLRSYTVQQEKVDAVMAEAAAAAAAEAQDAHDALHVDAALEESVREQLLRSQARAARKGGPAAVFVQHPVVSAIDVKYQVKPPAPVAASGTQRGRARRKRQY